MSEQDQVNSDCGCKKSTGVPDYMGTFADLMALLLCFFVLLLSFSEMDAFEMEDGRAFDGKCIRCR